MRVIRSIKGVGRGIGDIRKDEHMKDCWFGGFGGMIMSAGERGGVFKSILISTTVSTVSIIRLLILAFRSFRQT